MPVSPTASKSATATFQGYPDANNGQQTGGDQQNGSWASGSIGQTDLGGPNAGVIEGLPGAQRVRLPLTNGVTQCDPNNVTNQYQVFLSLSGNKYPQTITLSPVPATCQNEETEFISPATAQYLFSSRQRLVCSCSTTPEEFSASCTITAVGRGETEVVVVNPRAVNSMFASATASPTAGGSRATLRVIVLA